MIRIILFALGLFTLVPAAAGPLPVVDSSLSDVPASQPQVPAKAADTAAKAPSVPPAILPAIDEGPDIQHGAFFDRDGASYVFTEKHLAAMHAVNLCDVLDYLPGLITARGSLAGTLSDVKIPGKENYSDDKPVIVEVDGIEIRAINSDRVYLNVVPVSDVEKITVDERGGGFSGSEILIRVRTRQSHILDPVTNVFWEQGPFDMNAVKFSLKRRFGASTGFFIGMEKVYQAEGLGYYSGGTHEYSHPAAIVDIYRAVLQRPDSLYVGVGPLFENYSRLWNLKLNTLAVPGILLNAGYVFLRDAQDDYRRNPHNYSGSSQFLNFTSRQSYDNFSLTGRTIAFRRVMVEGAFYTYGRRLRYPVTTFSNTAGADSTSFSQGIDVMGGRLGAEYSSGGQRARLLIESAQDNILAQQEAGLVRRADRLEASLAINMDSLSGIPLVLSARNNLRRDSRVVSGTGINTALLASPWAGLHSLLFDGRLRLDADYGCERRYPNESALYFDNPKMNYTVAPLAFRRIISYRTGAAITWEGARTGLGYSYNGRFTRSPAVFVPESLYVGSQGWSLSQDHIRFEESGGHTFFGELKLNHVSEYAALRITRIHYARTDGWPTNPFLTLDVINRLALHRRFMKERLFGQVSFYTCMRPEVWSQDYYLPELGPRVLNAFIEFNTEIEFRIKAFSFFTRFENLGNQVISFDPGYFLPGPVIRWGIDWTFGG